LQQAILAIMQDQNIDALVYPTLRRKAAMIGDPQIGSTCTLSAATGFPAISVPAGFTDDGLPVGVELLAGPFDDGKLVAMAYAFEQSPPHRRAPAPPPPLTTSPANRLLTWVTTAAAGEVVPPVPSSLKTSVRLTFNLASNELRYNITPSAADAQILYVTLHRG